MTLKDTLNETKEVIGKITHRKKPKILSEEEIKKICDTSLSKILNNIVEVLNVKILFSSGFLDQEVFEKLCGKNKKRKYTCSIYAGSSEVIASFEKYLGPQDEENIRRIGFCGFWHYFINPAETLLSSLSVESIGEGAISLSGGEKVLDIIKANQPPF